MNNHKSGFFATLGRLAVRQQENQLSRTFQACFTESKSFQDAVFTTLRDVCGLALPAATWECRTEQAHGNGRIDIELRSEDRVTPTVILENKVESKLDVKQLRSYRSIQRGKLTHLVAITKARPASKKQLRDEEILCIRWQDLHRALQGVSRRDRVGRFLASSFTDYLESADMAYPEQLTLSGLERAARAIRATQVGSRQDGARVKTAFYDLHTASGLLQELAVDLREEFPLLMKRSRWGPAVFRAEWDGEAPTVCLGVALWRGRPNRRSFGWGWIFYLENSTIELYVESWVDGEIDDSVYFPAKTCFDKTGFLNRELVLKRLRHYAEKWSA